MAARGVGQDLGGAGSGDGHELFGVVDGEEVEQELRGARLGGAQEGLCVAGTGLAAQPDHGQARRRLDSGSDSRRVRGRKGEGGGHRGRELEERAARHAAPQERGIETVVRPGHLGRLSRVEFCTHMRRAGDRGARNAAARSW